MSMILQDLYSSLANTEREINVLMDLSCSSRRVLPCTEDPAAFLRNRILP